MSEITPIDLEIYRLSLLIASSRYDFEQSIKAGTPLALLVPVMQEICVMQLQRSALRDKRFKELPYDIKILYRPK